MDDDRERVYFAHGLMGTVELHFGALLEAWREDFRPVPFDLPGHGDCPVDAGESAVDGAYHYLLDRLRDNGPGHLVALSYLGCPIAVRCAREHPGLLRSLVLTGLGPEMTGEAFAEMQRAYLLLVERSPELVAEYERMHGPRWPRTLAAYAGHIDETSDELRLIRPAVLGALAVDVLLVNGTQRSVERTAAQQASGYGPRIQGAVLDGAGHIPSQDAPELLDTTIRRFWAGLR